MKLLKRIIAAALILSLLSALLCACDVGGSEGGGIKIRGDESIELELYDVYLIMVDGAVGDVAFAVYGSAVTVGQDGVLTAVAEGSATVIVTSGDFSDTLTVRVLPKAIDGGTGEGTGTGNSGSGSGSGAGSGSGSDSGSGSGDSGSGSGSDTGGTEPEKDPYANVVKSEFYSDYKKAQSYKDSVYRTAHGLMSGSIDEQPISAALAADRPTSNGAFIKNTSMIYGDNGNSYYVLNSRGEVVNVIYRGGGYVTLEEVAAHMYAFGEIPGNYVSKKSGSTANFDTWGKYLRVNHSYFSGDTDKYPYEPKLPNINGCGGDLQYYEMDIGTPGYNNGGYSIRRGAARIVYGREDLNRNHVFDEDEIYLFYTYNHYNDFQEYLNYEGGWGEMFGNVTGGGLPSSKTDYAPTPYVKTVRRELHASADSLCIVMFAECQYSTKRKQYIH